MSLRNQFFVSVLAALFLSLAVLGGLASWHARQSVQHEIQTALFAAHRSVQSTLATLPPSDVEGYVSQVVHGFDGNRHIRAEYKSKGQTRARSTLAEARDAPDWFVSLLQIPDETEHFALSGDSELILSTDAENETGEAWGQFRDGAIILGVFALLVVGLLHVLMDRTAVRLKKLAGGFDAVGGGNYDARVVPEGPAEISHLANAFNRMTDRLSKLETTNRQLHLQVQTIQEEERADVARDLHDEMGPFLFTMRIDADAISAQAAEQGLPALAARARSIGDSVTHIQKHVRNILQQLQPGDIADVGLASAIANLAAFWQRYHVGVNIHIDVTDVAHGFGEQIDGTIYRLVQESLTNAVRHGSAQDVSVIISDDTDGIHVHIEDNGVGLPDRNETGMGLRGMQERVTALGGTLTIGNRSKGTGTVVTAVIPQHHPAISERVETVS